ncbi:MAG: hypothetical protein WAT09_00365, partial [Paracoccaceae bacterium]
APGTDPAVIEALRLCLTEDETRTSRLEKLATAGWTAVPPDAQADAIALLAPGYAATIWSVPSADNIATSTSKLTDKAAQDRVELLLQATSGGLLWVEQHESKPVSLCLLTAPMTGADLAAGLQMDLILRPAQDRVPAYEVLTEKGQPDGRPTILVSVPAAVADDPRFLPSIRTTYIRSPDL